MFDFLLIAGGAVVGLWGAKKIKNKFFGSKYNHKQTNSDDEVVIQCKKDDNGTFRITK